MLDLQSGMISIECYFVSVTFLLYLNLPDAKHKMNILGL